MGGTMNYPAAIVIGAALIAGAIVANQVIPTAQANSHEVQSGLSNGLFWAWKVQGNNVRMLVCKGSSSGNISCQRGNNSVN